MIGASPGLFAIPPRTVGEACLPVALLLSIACGIPLRDQGSGDGRPAGLPFIFGVTASEAKEWGERAKRDPKIDLVEKQGFGGDSFYLAIPGDNLDNYLRDAPYVIVRRWFAVEDLDKIAEMATPLYPGFAEHLRKDITEIEDIRSIELPGPGTTPDRESAVEAYIDRSNRNLFKPRKAGGFGAIGCETRGRDHPGATFIPVVETAGLRALSERVKLGHSLLPQERVLYERYRSSQVLVDFVMQPITH